MIISKINVMSLENKLGEQHMKPETAVKLVEVLENLNRSKKLLAVASILTITLAGFDFGILGDENPDDWSVL